MILLPVWLPGPMYGEERAVFILLEICLFFHFCFRSGEVKQLRSAVGFNVFALLIHE